jgi:hypothetical protein
MWEIVIKLDRPQMTIWCLRIVCWVPNAKNIHSEHVIFIAFPLQKLFHERPPVLRYTHIACLVEC